MSLISSNGVNIESISIKGLHNKTIELLMSLSKKNLPWMGFAFVERQGENKYILKTMTICIPGNVWYNPTPNDENILTMKKYLYNRFKESGIPLKNIDLMCDSIKEKDYIL